MLSNIILSEFASLPYGGFIWFYLGEEVGSLQSSTHLYHPPNDEVFKYTAFR